MTFPLDDIRVADFSRVLAGPLVGMTLGDLGADVIKVESPWGDETRGWGPPFDLKGRATYHHAANRNKRSVVLDLSEPDDLELARRLCDRADVVIANFRPGTLERFDLAHEQVAARNPGVIHCEISGFGDDAPELPGYDPLIQAVGGLMSITGPPGTPSKVGVALVDVIAGLYGTTGILAALHQREHDGRGQRLTINLLHACLAALANQATGFLATGEAPRPLGNIHPSIEPFATYACADGDLMICAGNDRQFAALAEVIGVPELAGDERFASNSARVSNRDELRPLLEERLAARGAEEWARTLGERGVPIGPVQDIGEAFALASRLGIEAANEHDGVRTVAYPVGLGRTPAATRRRPPEHDEHGAEIREWLAG